MKKKTKKKKYLFILFIISSLTFLASWGKKRIELLNDKKLIVLNTAIEKCIPRADTSEEPETSVSASNTPLSEEITTGDVPSEETFTEEVLTEETMIEDKERVIVIAIKDRTVIYDSEEYTNLNKLKETIRQDNGEHVSFRLVDDFAESHIYKKVLSILSELEAEIGLNYTKE